MMSILTLNMALSAPAEASSGGYVRAADRGCRSCHGNAPSADTTVTLIAPTLVEPGQAVTLSLTIENSGQTEAGLNVAATGGSFTGGDRSWVVQGEITHTSPARLSGGEYTFSFDWTAPAEEGTYTIFAVGNAVNGDGRSSGDDWNLTQASIAVGSECVDLDEDGVTNCDGDCDDSDETIFPGANEIEDDDIDQDCDGFDAISEESGDTGEPADTDDPIDTDEPTDPDDDLDTSPHAEDEGEATGCSHLGGVAGFSMWFIGSAIGSFARARRTSSR